MRDHICREHNTVTKSGDADELIRQGLPPCVMCAALLRTADRRPDRADDIEGAELDLNEADTEAARAILGKYRT